MRTDPLAVDPIELPKEYLFSHAPFPAKWIAPGDFAPEKAGVWAFRNRISGAKAGKVRVHVSADQRYILFLDGKRLGRGPERGDFRHWMYDSYDLDLTGGDHTLVAIVWWISPYADVQPAEAQQTVRPAFWLMAEGVESMQTGVGTWEYKPIDGITFSHHRIHKAYYAIDPRISVDGTKYPFNIEQGGGDGWQAARTLHAASNAAVVTESQPHWLLRPAMLPGMHESLHGTYKTRHVEQVDTRETHEILVNSKNAKPDEAAQWDAMLTQGKSVQVPAKSRRRVIVDLQNYICAYTSVVVSGGRGASVRLLWAESLYLYDPKIEKNGLSHSQRKENRNEIEGRHFMGYGDTFTTDGSGARTFHSLWWASGRYIEVLVETADEPVTIESIALTTTGYPYDFKGTFEASEPRLAKVMELGLRTLQMCSHETSMDCPFFEQLNYTGDTRLQSLVAMATSTDNRLVQKGLTLFDWSRSGDTWTSSRYPTRTLQTIPPFAMFWTNMAYDYALYRGDREYLSQRMPGVRSILERWRQQIRDDGVLILPAGWNFVDWIPGWPGGTRNQIGGPSGPAQWQLVYTLELAAKLEEMLGEPLLAQRNRQTAAALAATAERIFFDKSRGLLADDIDHTKYTEHTQVWALISGHLSKNLREAVSQPLIQPKDLPISSIYFSHYTFEALREIGRIDVLLQRMGQWFDLTEKGLYTLIEQPEPSRSDCHAWGAHPIYHYYASILGIRPTSFGFDKVDIAPNLGTLTWAKGEMIHPRGTIRMSVEQKNGKLAGEVTLPTGVSGQLRVNGGTVQLKEGTQSIG